MKYAHKLITTANRQHYRSILDSSALKILEDSHLSTWDNCKKNSLCQLASAKYKNMPLQANNIVNMPGNSSWISWTGLAGAKINFMPMQNKLGKSAVFAVCEGYLLKYFFTQFFIFKWTISFKFFHLIFLFKRKLD